MKKKYGIQDKKLNKIIGRNIKCLRYKHGVLASQLAGHLDVSLGTISHIECGETAVKLPHLQSIALYFKVPIDELFLETGIVLEHNITRHNPDILTNSLKEILDSLPKTFSPNQVKATSAQLHTLLRTGKISRQYNSAQCVLMYKKR
jgi:transcriptional regulator with XRE-family HTH domain